MINKTQKMHETPWQKNNNNKNDDNKSGKNKKLKKIGFICCGDVEFMTQKTKQASI